MAGIATPRDPIDSEHMRWVQTRMMLDAELIEAGRHGFTLIAAGFGSFSLFEGLTLGERQVSELPRAFALIATAVGVLVIVLAVNHHRKMAAWIDTDEFRSVPVPGLPDENRPRYLAIGAAVIGVVSFIALLLLP